MAQPADLKRLHAWLQTALEIELAVIPPYLVALLSIELPGNRVPAELIRSVMIEEMLHLALVANVMNAVGARPRLDRNAIPEFPLTLTFEGKPFRDRAFPVDLAPFSAATIDTFLQIEAPRQTHAANMFSVELGVPAPTVGEFYSKIEDLLVELDAEGGLFRSGTSQISQDYYWAGGGRIVEVTDLATAREALDLVIAQGEGAPQPATSEAAGFTHQMTTGHYFRFLEIAKGRFFGEDDDPAGDPTGATIAVDFSATYPVKVSPKAADYPAGSPLAKLNDDFNRRYTAMLRQLEEAFNGSPRTLYTAIMDSMHELTPLAHEMMKLPTGEPDGSVGCPTFEWMDS